MCRLKSAIILKDRVFVPDYDSHTDMLKELGIEDTKANAERLFIRAELYPANGDGFSDIDTWEFNVDQDILPDWYVKEYDKQRMIEAVKEWAKDRIHIGVDGLDISNGAGHRIKDCKNVFIRDNATVEDICGNTTVGYIRDSVTVGYIRDSVTVEYIRGSVTVGYIRDSVTVKYIRDSVTVGYIRDSVTVGYIRDSVTVEYIRGSVTVGYIRDSATVKYICDSATIVTSPATKWDKLSKANLSGNATIKDCFTKTIYQSGNWTFKEVKNEE